MMESIEEAYNKGYAFGIEDNMPDNPYAEGTPEYDAWEEGFEDGSWDL